MNADKNSNTKDNDDKETKKGAQPSLTSTTKATTTITNLDNQTTRGKRIICNKCNYPAPATCVCEALPTNAIALTKCRVLVLQHPHEAKRKNRSLPLIELCLKKQQQQPQGNVAKEEHNHQNNSTTPSGKTTTTKTSHREADWNIRTVIARRFGNQIDPAIMKLLKDTTKFDTKNNTHPQHHDILLVYPSPDAVSLEQGLQLIHERRMLKRQRLEEEKRKTEEYYNTDEKHPQNDAIENKDDNEDDKKITVIILDATWRYAMEMEKANVMTNQYPDHLIRVTLRPSSEKTITTMQINSISSSSTSLPPKKELPSSSNQEDSKQRNQQQLLTPKDYKSRRFDIRTPPSDNHLSTGECIAWVVAAIEEKPYLYSTLMKPMDLMVQHWHSFSRRSNTTNNNNTRGGGDSSFKRSFTDGDGFQITKMEQEGEESNQNGHRRFHGASSLTRKRKNNHNKKQWVEF